MPWIKSRMVVGGAIALSWLLVGCSHGGPASSAAPAGKIQEGSSPATAAPRLIVSVGEQGENGNINACHLSLESVEGRFYIAAVLTPLCSTFEADVQVLLNGKVISEKPAHPPAFVANAKRDFSTGLFPRPASGQTVHVHVQAACKDNVEKLDVRAWCLIP
jgi:hypothetical protein